MGTGLTVAALACAALALLCLVVSTITREHSWVDRLWSVVPVGYVAWFAVCAGRADGRLALMTGLVAAWGVRLTYNFARKGGYRPGGEDYRWAVLRRRMRPAAFFLFNVLFVSAFQHALLLLLALPAWDVARRPPVPLGGVDALATVLFVAFLVGETVADEQQWRFQRRKAARRRDGDESGPGFLSEGLFRYSRHPNFFCEQGLWWSFWLFAPASGAPWLGVALLGPVLLTALFQGSTAFTESISAGRYPGYADYARRTSRQIPLPPGRGA